MFGYELNIPIRRRPADVFDFLCRAENIPKWAAYLESAEADPPGILRAGSRVIEQGDRKGVPTEVVWTVTEAVPDERIVFETSNQISAWAQVVFEVKPEEGGVLLFVTARGKARGLYRLVEPFITRRITKLRKIELARMKELLESDA